MYNVQQKDYHLVMFRGHVISWQLQVANAKRCRRDAAVVLLMHPAVLMRWLNEELSNEELN